MAYREFDAPQLSRRALLRGGAYLSAGAALSGAGLSQGALARTGSASWTNVAQLVNSYVDSGKLANMVAAMGWGQDGPQAIANGTLVLGGTVKADLDSSIASIDDQAGDRHGRHAGRRGRMRLDQPIADFLPFAA